MNMKVTRRMLVTAAFVLLTFLIATAASTYYDLLFLFYPSFCRELLGYLAQWSAKFSFVLWQKVLIIAAIAAFVFLIVRIVCKKNVLVWLFSLTSIASVFLCLYMLMWGANHYGPSIAEPMRMQVRSATSAQLQEAAEYYRDQANDAADKVTRGPGGLCAMLAFDALAADVGSGFSNMTRTCYIFGGDTTPPKKLGWAKLLRKLDISSLMVCYTGEAGIHPDVLPATMPFLMERTVAQRMSIAKDDDDSFAAILTCIASDSTAYNYSGYFMAYQYCYNALLEEDPLAAATVDQGVSPMLRADLEANKPLPEDSEEEAPYLCVPALVKNPDAEHPIHDLLVAWYIQLTTPPEEEEEPFDPNAIMQTDSDADTEPDAETEPDTETDTEPDAGTDTVPGAGTNSAPNAGTTPAPGAGNDTEPDAGTTPAPDAGNDPAPDAGTNPAPDTGNDPAPDAGTTPAPDTGNDPAPDAGTGPAPDAGTEPDAGGEPAPDTV